MQLCFPRKKSFSVLVAELILMRAFYNHGSPKVPITVTEVGKTMADEKPSMNSSQIQIATGDEMSRGRYSNTMLVSHSAEEFMMEWLLSSPSGTHLVSRIIVSPCHVKRIIAALTENLNKYEDRFGPVRVVENNDQAFH